MAPQAKLDVTVEKPTPYEFDLGSLLAHDVNPVDIAADATSEQREAVLAELAREGAQAMVNQLLTTCRLASTKDGVFLHLPPARTHWPREKPLPAAKPLTKWQRFAAKKGIAPKTREQRRNLVFDAETQQWRPKWGTGGANKKGEDDWLVEVDAHKEDALRDGETIRGVSRRERKERVRINERKHKKNLLHAAKK